LPHKNRSKTQGQEDVGGVEVIEDRLVTMSLDNYKRLITVIQIAREVGEIRQEQIALGFDRITEEVKNELYSYLKILDQQTLDND